LRRIETRSLIIKIAMKKLLRRIKLIQSLKIILKNDLLLNLSGERSDGVAVKRKIAAIFAVYPYAS
jgi:hypothetical protein